MSYKTSCKYPESIYIFKRSLNSIGNLLQFGCDMQPQQSSTLMKIIELD